ncbi:MAG: VOC family protein [Balneolaceae bacterium]|nr:VOC family protein [Balneolaceae bacterium]
MVDSKNRFSSFAVDDMEAATTFYTDTLGLDLTEGEMGTRWLHVGDNRRVLIYTKPNHTPATFTILNFPVDDIEEAVDQLTGEGIEFEQYNEFNTDEKGVARGDGPLIAWFKDPAENILSLIEE